MSKSRCPICAAAMPGNWAEYPDHPFCSRRCKQIDLGRWLGEAYRISSDLDDDVDQSTPGQGGMDSRDTRSTG